jgi:peptidyl-prolyl cis-trans isomerase D
MRSIFGDNAIKRHQNTEAVEVAPNIIIAARVTEHEPAKAAAYRRSAVRRSSRRSRSKKPARPRARKGEALLEKLRAGGEASPKWSSPQMVTRETREGLHPEAAAAVFAADASKLPAYVGVPAQGGRYVIYRVGKVVDIDSVDPAQRKEIAKQLAPIAGQENLAARIGSLKQNADVKIDAKKLEKAS